MSDTAVVVPCYNERDRLDASRFVGYLDRDGRTDLIFVDDGSIDGTASVLLALRKARPGRVECLRLERNRGKAEAVRRGVLHAAERGYGVIGYLDADLSAPPEAVAVLRERLEARGMTIVLGSRVMLLGRSIRRNPFRHYVGRVFATMASIVLRERVYDTQCGAKIFRNTPMLHRVFSAPFHGRWTFDVELLARARIYGRARLGMALEEFAMEWPLEAWHDVGGSRLKPLDFPRAALALLALFIRLRCPFLGREYAGRFSRPP